MPLEYARDKGDFADLSNGRIFYQWHGPVNGPVTVLVHGLSTPSFVWCDMLPPLVAAGQRVLTFDHFGRGFSEFPGQDQTSDFFIKELDELLDSLGVVEPVNLLGYSMGGGIVASYGAARPHRIRRLIFLAPVGFRTELGGFFNRLVLVPVLGDILMALFGPRAMRKALLESERLEGVTPTMVAMQCAETRQPAFAAAVLSSLRHVIRADVSAAHKKIAQRGMPTCAIFAENDTVIPLAGAEALRRLNPQTRIVTIADAGHGLAYTHAEQVAETLLAFISRPAPSAPA